MKAMADKPQASGRPCWVAPIAGTAFVVDCESGSLLDATPAALELLGLDATSELPAQLDRGGSMVAALRQLPRNQQASRHLTLSLTSQSGADSLECLVRPIVHLGNAAAWHVQPQRGRSDVGLPPEVATEVRHAGASDQPPERAAEKPLQPVVPNSERVATARSPTSLLEAARAADRRERELVEQPRIQSVLKQPAEVRLQPRPLRASAPEIPQSDLATLQEIARRIREGRTTSPFAADDIGRGDAARSGNEPAAETPTDSATSASVTSSATAVDAAASDAIRSASHEIRTPLAAIAALAEVIRDEHYGPVGDARYRTYARDIAKSARHALSVIDATLGGVPDDTQPELVITEIDVDELVRDCRATMAPLAAQAGLGLTSTTCDRPPHIIADARALKQILLNLLTNALKFTPAGGSIKMTVACVPGGPMTLTVSDTGDGLTPAEVAAAVQGRRMSGGAGNGLGLVISQQLAARNGATLKLLSPAGEGLHALLIFPRDRLVPV